MEGTGNEKGERLPKRSNNNMDDKVNMESGKQAGKADHGTAEPVFDKLNRLGLCY